MTAFIFASTTVWYPLGKKFQSWKENEEKKAKDKSSPKKEQKSDEPDGEESMPRKKKPAPGGGLNCCGLRMASDARADSPP